MRKLLNLPPLPGEQSQDRRAINESRVDVTPADRGTGRINLSSFRGGLQTTILGIAPSNPADKSPIPTALRPSLSSCTSDTYPKSALVPSDFAGQRSPEFGGLRHPVRKGSQRLSSPEGWISVHTHHRPNRKALGFSQEGPFNGRAVVNLVTDARVVTQAIEHGCVPASTVADCARFSKLKWNVPKALSNPGKNCIAVYRKLCSLSRFVRLLSTYPG